MQGKIIRGVGGFYYVHVPEMGLLECKAKGVFRNRKVKPLVGDDVEVEVLDEENRLGNISDILPRHSELIRPAVANVDQAVVIFAASYPKPNLNLLDRFLLMMKWQDVPVRICFNKLDAADDSFITELEDIYRTSGAEVFFTSTYSGEGLELLHDHLAHKTTVLAGPSGVGKSSVMNAIFPEAEMEIGEISTKIKRGKHTTRHSELFFLPEQTYVMDTPGFTSLSLPDIEKEELREYYEEFKPYTEHCRFQGCVHVNEPDCSVKLALEQGEIAENRYENYLSFYEELRRKKRYK
ncbi:MAG: ribosome small subunit-dependent GTPase A [Lachnospiraceae bacterium]|nr:ribosome small subunit-dependent GTPase A [Lachnospiraceae bacterium]